MATTLLSTGLCLAQPTKTITTTIFEPASVSLAALFAQADLVAFVQVRSGDAERYDVAVYKAVVLKAYKGSKVDDLIYFTPFISYGLGSEYLVFLKKTNKHIIDIVAKDSKKKSLPYDSRQSFYRIMYEGYSVMAVSFECIFEKPTHQRCDYAVKFNVMQVKLPPELNIFPQEEDDSAVLDIKYVKKKKIESILESLGRHK